LSIDIHNRALQLSLPQAPAVTHHFRSVQLRSKYTKLTQLFQLAKTEGENFALTLLQPLRVQKNSEVLHGSTSLATKLIFQGEATGSDIKIKFVKSTDETVPGHRKALLQEDQIPAAAENQMGFNEWQILGQQ